MKELKANMAVLGKEAAAALDAVEAQQQRLSFQRLIVTVEGERTYHQRIAIILGEAESEMVSEKQGKESAPPRPTQVSRAETSSFGSNNVRKKDNEFSSFTNSSRYSQSPKLIHGTMMTLMDCGHYFCNNCWTGYFIVKLVFKLMVSWQTLLNELSGAMA